MIVRRWIVGDRRWSIERAGSLLEVVGEYIAI